MPPTLSLSPAGHLLMLREESGADQAALAGGEKPSPAEVIVEAFAVGQAEGLLTLVGTRPNPSWPPAWLYWREFAGRYLTALCHLSPENRQVEPLPPPAENDLARLALALPPMPGAEYVSAEILAAIWHDLDVRTRAAVGSHPEGLAGFLQQRAPLWRQVGRVCFHLAENKNDPERPFAFLATYVAGLGKNARLQHQPLSRALAEYAGARNREALLRLLEPVHEAGSRCNWVRDLAESGDLYHPLAWSPDEAHAFLRSVPDLEASGLVVRLPDWWKKRPRPRVRVAIDGKQSTSLNAAALLSFRVRLTMEDEELTEAEIAALLAASDGLTLLRGQWVEVDSRKLRQALAHWRQVEAGAGADGLSFLEGMRLLAGSRRDLGADDTLDEETGWAFVEAGPWLREILGGLRAPENLAAVRPGAKLKTTLRPYQQVGLNWLWFLGELGLGACLADDMGLGKTVQVIALLLAQQQRREKQPPSLLVLPASLLANWKSEIERFAPSLKTLSLHAAEQSRPELDRLAAAPAAALAGIDVVLTTYGMLLRQPWLTGQAWNLIVLDEAQAIKNPSARQSKAVKALQGRARLALTGTPIENRLGDLWSLFDFLCPGLLGSAARFKSFVATMEKSGHASYAPLRRLIQPYILRRLKTDKRIIDDLPEKTEITAWCGLSRAQAALYRQAVRELAAALDGKGGIARRGLILSYLLRFKQICNHPSQAGLDGDYEESASGKFLRLREIVEEIAARQEKVLVFTQYREMTAPLAVFLASLFGRPGLVLHGGTPVKERQRLVSEFQQEGGPPFFVLSLKAAGIGLNLTAASQVIHFDRWWNPAVENQATDRAFRIGQHRNVLVHKFVCRGTVEEKIDALITAKTELATGLLEGGGETLLTEMDDAALLDLVSLDIDRATF